MLDALLRKELLMRNERMRKCFLFYELSWMTLQSQCGFLSVRFDLRGLLAGQFGDDSELFGHVSGRSAVWIFIRPIRPEAGSAFVLSLHTGSRIWRHVRAELCLLPHFSLSGGIWNTGTSYQHIPHEGS